MAQVQASPEIPKTPTITVEEAGKKRAVTPDNRGIYRVPSVPSTFTVMHLTSEGKSGKRKVEGADDMSANRFVSLVSLIMTTPLAFMHDAYLENILDYLKPTTDQYEHLRPAAVAKSGLASLCVALTHQKLHSIARKLVYNPTYLADDEVIMDVRADAHLFLRVEDLLRDQYLEVISHADEYTKAASLAGLSKMLIDQYTDERRQERDALGFLNPYILKGVRTRLAEFDRKSDSGQPTAELVNSVLVGAAGDNIIMCRFGEVYVLIGDRLHAPLGPAFLGGFKNKGETGVGCCKRESAEENKFKLTAGDVPAPEFDTTVIYQDEMKRLHDPRPSNPNMKISLIISELAESFCLTDVE
jgi:hypothetical protein